ncbi:aryl-alcohol oxidase-like protein [Crucibulum laeve]|uniref:pyranose dehydrogenase (acceptor) n=1 Tax=Crucibulum laeve TaxID=68775 RepID=A0A5C3LG00_9AGAR|nr:aryl-alcohol oxidase-like protein [Crucibulum laeve]
MLLLVLFSIISFLAIFVNAKTFTSAADLVHHNYDFIIVGGGTAGCVLANRLSETPSVKILMIEAGVSADGNLNTEVPFLGVTLPGSTLDWNFTSTSQVGLNGRTVPYPRGQTLGGTSVINLLTWNRGSNDLWNKWASITNDEGWSWNNIQKYYLRTSRLVKPADGHDITGEVIPALHGNGPVQVSVPGFPTDLDDRVVNSSKLLGGRFPYNEDFNSGNNVGVGFMQSTVGNGARSHSANAYLEPVLTRPNLDLLIDTHVTKLIQTSAKGETPIKFGTVEVAASATAQLVHINAKKEVILSAGAFGTPQILLLSGIGPRAHLENKGISTAIDLPVGQNLTDQPLLASYYLINSNQTFNHILSDPSAFNTTLQEWITSKQGLFVDSPGNTQGFVRLPANSSILKQFPDPASGPLSPHTEFIFVDGFAQFGPVTMPTTGNFMTVLTVVVSPLSRGNISLATSNPFDKPLINPGLLTHKFDILAMVQAIKDVQTFIQAGPWANFVQAPFGDLATAKTDDLKAAFARNFTGAGSHPSGSAPMSSSESNRGVVDSKLLVKGASGLRVVDASVFPLIPECHIQAPVYIIAERAADLIKLAHGFPTDLSPV